MSSTDMPTEARGFPVRSVLLRHGDRGAALVGLIDGTPVFILCATTATEG